MPGQDVEEIVDKRMKEIKRELGDRPIYGATREGFWSRIGWLDGIGLLLFVTGLIVLFISLIWELSGTFGEFAIITSLVGASASVMGLFIATYTWSQNRQEHIALQNGYILEESFRQSAILQQQTEILTNIREALEE